MGPAESAGTLKSLYMKPGPGFGPGPFKRCESPQERLDFRTRKKCFFWSQRPLSDALSLKLSCSGSEAQGYLHRGRDRVREELDGAPPRPETKINPLIPTPYTLNPKL